ncbi:MAG TPA: rRNA maturation RNase YbeY [Actinomycetota bacterium]|nr:rRNA maturation RNase YbeY [Actinomycetota bacterium]
MNARATNDDDGGGYPRVLVSNRMTDAPGSMLDEPALADLARATLVKEGHVDVELSLAFVDDEEIAELHERYMHEAGPTDVLTFPLDDEHDVDELGVRVLGDVVIAPQVAVRNNPDDPGSELRLLVVHGVLHALGYDHEEDEERLEMWARQERYSGVPVP